MRKLSCRRRWISQACAAIIVAILLWAVAPAPAGAGGSVSITRTFQPSSADSRVKQTSPTSTAGSDNYIEINPETDKVDRGLVQFDISSIPSGSSVSSATFFMYFHYTDDTSSRTHNVHRITESWTEAGVTWNSRNGTNNWGTAGGSFNSTATDSQTISISTPQWVSWTVTSDASAFVAGSASNYGWMVKDDEGVSTTLKRQYRSKEYSTTSQRPKLAVTFTAPWDSYESDYTTGKDTYNGSSPTVYMNGTGFQDVSYLVAYYDADGTKRGTQTVSASGGTLNSSYDPYTQGGASAGTWHVLVQPSSGYTAFGENSYATIVAAPDTYGLLANDSFTYELDDIPPVPELSTFMLVGIGMMGLGAYFWFNRRRMAAANAK